MVDGRFKGGYITRRYGTPATGISAVQIELVQKNYMDESFPYAYDEPRAVRLQTFLKAALQAALEWSRG